MAACAEAGSKPISTATAMEACAEAGSRPISPGVKRPRKVRKVIYLCRLGDVNGDHISTPGQRCAVVHSLLLCSSGLAELRPITRICARQHIHLARCCCVPHYTGSCFLSVLRATRENPSTPGEQGDDFLAPPRMPHRQGTPRSHRYASRQLACMQGFPSHAGAARIRGGAREAFLGTLREDGQPDIASRQVSTVAGLQVFVGVLLCNVECGRCSRTTACATCSRSSLATPYVWWASPRLDTAPERPRTMLLTTSRTERCV